MKTKYQTDLLIFALELKDILRNSFYVKKSMLKIFDDIICLGSSSDIVNKPIMEDDPQRRKPDIARAKEICGWEPVVTYLFLCLLVYFQFMSSIGQRAFYPHWRTPCNSCLQVLLFIFMIYFILNWNTFNILLYAMISFYIVSNQSP